MKISLMNTYSDEAFEKIVKMSDSYKDCLSKLGYHSFSGDTVGKLRSKIEKLGIDISHFHSIRPIKRNPENIFYNGSKVDHGTVKRWYKKGNYTPYVCAICGQEPMWQGKPMPLILDHINGYNKDNRLENLRWVCGNCNLQLDTTNGKNKNHGVRLYHYCIDCGKKVSKNAERCIDCNKKVGNQTQCVIYEDNIIFPNSNKPVYRRELKDLIRNKSFTYIGEYYGVSDNAVRKWCKRFGLPTKSLEIRKISDEDWEKI